MGPAALVAIPIAEAVIACEATAGAVCAATVGVTAVKVGAEVYDHL